jgi:hypothetical protein
MGALRPNPLRPVGIQPKISSPPWRLLISPFSAARNIATKSRDALVLVLRLDFCTSVSLTHNHGRHIMPRCGYSLNSPALGADANDFQVRKKGEAWRP